MEVQEQLKHAMICHGQATNEMLWNKIHDVFRYLNEIADLNANANPAITKYLHHINEEEPHYFQDISVENMEIDLVLRRYMMEAAMLRMIIEFDIDPLGGISEDTKIGLIQTLDKCFASIFCYLGKENSFLHIKIQDEKILVWANRQEESVFHAEIQML